MSVVAIAATALLSACGGGDGAATPAVTAPAQVVAPVAAAISPAQASRFLGQATMGATRKDIDALVSRGFDGWLTDQFAMPRATSHWDWLVANGYSAAANVNTQNGFDTSVWRQLIVEPDQLRQRVGMALLDIMVVGIGGVVSHWAAFQMAAYVDLLLDNAFGNFRALLDGISTNAAMGSFMSFVNNRKANPTTGAQPDENYARELMQLYTLGLYQLNIDGTAKQAGGNPIETYGQADVSGLARIFTGLTYSSTDMTTPDRYRQPMVMNSGANESGASSFLGTSVAGGGMAAIKTALDTIFAHGNLPPFISKQLIQRLVTSNPSAAYIQRVATVFTDNGSGVRGDMKAVIKAILMDTEARSDSTLTGVGKLREPIMRLTGWARACAVTSPSNAWAFGDNSSPSSRLGQSPGRAPSAFGFFRPGYSPPNTDISRGGLVAPEFQIANEQSVVGYVNYMFAMVNSGAGDAKPDYSAFVAKASDAGALVDEVNLVLAAGQLGTQALASIRAAVESIGTTWTNASLTRVMTAVILTLASPDFLAVK